jgi:hypothetical protein
MKHIVYFTLAVTVYSFIPYIHYFTGDISMQNIWVKKIAML